MGLFTVGCVRGDKVINENLFNNFKIMTPENIYNLYNRSWINSEGKKFDFKYQDRYFYYLIDNVEKEPVQTDFYDTGDNHLFIIEPNIIPTKYLVKIIFEKPTSINVTLPEYSEIKLEVQSS